MTGLAQRLVASVFALLWGRCPWGRDSLRLESYIIARRNSRMTREQSMEILGIRPPPATPRPLYRDTSA